MMIQSFPDQNREDVLYLQLHDFLNLLEPAIFLCVARSDFRIPPQYSNI